MNINPHRLKAFLYLGAATLIWGAAAVVIKMTLSGIEPLPFLFYRFFISAVIGVLSLGNIKKVLSRERKDLIAIFFHSIFSTTIALGFLFLGLNKTTVLNLTLITLISPLLAEYAGVIFLKEHITKKEKIGSVIAFVGAAFVALSPIWDKFEGFGELEGNILLLLYLFSDIAAVIILKKLLRKRIPALELTNISFIIGFITIIPIALFSYGFTEIINIIKSTRLPYHLGVFYMAVFSGTIAYTFRAKGQKTVEVGEAALFGYLTSVASVPFAIILLGEKITLSFLIGALIIILGVIVAELKHLKLPLLKSQ